MTEQQQYEIAKHSCLGGGLVLRNYSTSIFDRERKEVASASLIRLADRVFVATAGHVIPLNPTGRLWLINRRGRHERDGFPGFLRWRRHPDASKDVGYLELDLKTAGEYFGHTDFATVDNLADYGIGREGRGIIGVGTPESNVRTAPANPSTILARFEAMPYWTLPLMIDEWPVVDSKDRPGDPEIDVFLDYPEDECQSFETQEASRLPDAPGMSGGGVWDQGFESGDLWSPRSCKLLAIQGSWSNALRYLRATQVRHWVNLIRSDYPDLDSLFNGWKRNEV